jgi:uncharacterized protein YjbI with pentapeptide repeats
MKEVYYTENEISEIIELHQKWLDDEEGGVRADLTNANLTGAKLIGANLTDAKLIRANLYGADLTDKVNLTIQT